MKIIKIILLVFIGFYAPNAWAQDTPTNVSSNQIYSDRITDEYGTPMAGVKVAVRNKSLHAYSDINGEFSIHATVGDMIVLTKDGEEIGSYRLDGSVEYKVDATHIFNKEDQVSTKKKSRGQVTHSISYLDSASYYLNKDSYKSIDFVTQHLDHANEISKKELAKSFELLGDNYTRLNQYDLALENYKTAIKSSTSTSLKIKWANSLFQNGLFEKSRQAYQQLLTLSPSHWQEVITYEGLANSNEALGQINRAITHYNKALSLARKYQITPKISEINTQLAKILANSGKESEAKLKLEESLEESESVHVNQRLQVQNSIADIYQNNNDYDNEIEVRKRSLEAFGFISGDEVVVKDANKETVLSKPQINFEIGRAYVDKNEFDKAIPYLEKSAHEARFLHNLEIQKNAVQKLSELYRSTGNSKKALQKYQEYAKIVDLLYQQKEEEIQAVVGLNRELQNKQNRINSLEKDRALTSSQLQLSKKAKELESSNYKRQKLLVYGLLAGLLLFAVVLFYMIRSNKQRKLANNLLALKSLRSQMNPHFIFNALNSVNSFIAQSDERAANRYLTDFSQLMRAVLNNSEEDFIPLEKEIELLQLYIKLEHSRFEDKFDYEINIGENVQVSSFQIPPMLIQPYVENAVWHGLRYKKEKGKLLIEFTQRDTETIVIRISDDGIGRSQSKALKTQNQKKQQSKGMGNIKSRIQILNEMYSGKIDISIHDLSDDGTGTRVELVLKRT